MQVLQLLEFKLINLLTLKSELTSSKNIANKIVMEQICLPPLFKLPKVTTFTYSKDGAIAQSFIGMYF